MDFLTEPVSHDEAADFIKSKPAVTRAVFDKLLPELKARAFTVAGLEHANELQAVRDLIAEVPRGGDWDEIKRQIADQVSPYFIDPDADPEVQASQRAAGDRRAELLLRLHGFQAYSAAAYRALDEQRDVFPYWQYKSMGDGKVRHTHRALNDIALPAGDPFWNGHYPPWEWGCRCQVVGLMDIDVEEIRAADKDKPLEKHRIIEGEARKQLVENGRLVKGPTEIFDVRTPVQKGKPGAFAWNPADLRISLADLKARYDEPVWDAFEGWAKNTALNNGTVWDWLNGIVEKPAPGSWPDLNTLTTVRALGGSTGATLMRDPLGREFVIKRGNSADHVREEVAADSIYEALGLRVPRATLIETSSGPVKMAEFVDGKPLSAVLKTKSAEAVLNKIREGFVADALLGNWDVAGLDFDNIIVDASGNPWRIDNGGSLRFRAQGKAKTPAEWGDVVNELKSLRDPNLNPQTARIFAGITDDEIQRQITAILDKREAILAAAPPEVSATLAKRLDNLAQRLAPKGEITPQFSQDVQKSRILGRTYLGDFEHIEDHSILFWQERDGKKALTTRAKLRFTEAGFAAIRDKIGPVLQAATPSASSGPQPLGTDAFWQPIYGALKTVNHHASDGAYNADTIAKFTQAEAALAAFQAKTADEKAMKAAYTKIAEEIRAAMAAKTGTKKHEQYLAQPKAQPAPKPGDLRAEITNMVYSAKERTRGHATEKGASVTTIAGAYRIALGDVEITFAPWDSNTPYAHRGVATIRMPGEATPERMQKAIDAIKELGIDARPTPPEVLELVYLKKTLNFAKPDGDWQQILSTAKPDAEKVAELKAWVKKKMKLDLATSPDYQPNGTGNAWGDGWKVWNRWDLPPAKIASELPGYGLHHNVSGSLPEFLSSILDGGGQVTNTMERMRVGVPIGSGMSPVQDQGTGGANYFFTRIRANAVASPATGLTFKIDRLARADAYSFPSDYFGDVRPVGQNSHTTDPQKSRGKKISDYQRFATKSGNETIFKNGLNLLDDVEVIRTSGPNERQLVLEVFARHGIDTLPDGRLVKDIIK